MIAAREITSCRDMKPKNLALLFAQLVLISCLVACCGGSIFSDHVLDASECPDGGDWQYNSDTGSCYMVTSSTYNFDDCIDVCRPGHRVCINTATEDDAVHDLFGAAVSSNGSAFFIGFNDRQKETHWQWELGCSSDYENFGEGQPNNCNGDEHCAASSVTDDQTHWIDRSCTDLLRCVCEFETSDAEHPQVYNVTHSTLIISNSRCGRRDRRGSGDDEFWNEVTLTTIPVGGFFFICLVAGLFALVYSRTRIIHLHGEKRVLPADIDMHIGGTTQLFRGSAVIQLGIKSTTETKPHIVMARFLADSPNSGSAHSVFFSENMHHYRVASPYADETARSDDMMQRSEMMQRPEQQLHSRGECQWSQGVSSQQQDHVQEECPHSRNAVGLSNLVAIRQQENEWSSDIQGIDGTPLEIDIEAYTRGDDSSRAP